jgi:hypothetical protein
MEIIIKDVIAKIGIKEVKMILITNKYKCVINTIQNKYQSCVAPKMTIKTNSNKLKQLYFIDDYFIAFVSFVIA